MCGVLLLVVIDFVVGGDGVWCIVVVSGGGYSSSHFRFFVGFCFGINLVADKYLTEIYL